MNYGAINIDPKMGGTPVFTGTRVPVKNLFEYIERDEELSEFFENFPSISKEAALAVLKMAKKLISSKKVLRENFAW